MSSPVAYSKPYLEAQRRELESRLTIDLLDDGERVRLERALVDVLERLKTAK